MTLQDYKTMSNKLYRDIHNKGITCSIKRGEYANVASLIISDINRALYGRTQKDIVSELLARKKPISLPSKTPLLSTFDELHHACRIVVLRKVLVEMEFNADYNGDLSRINPYKWQEIAFDMASHIRGVWEGYKVTATDSLYKDYIRVATKNSKLEEKSYKDQKACVLKALSRMGRIPNTVFENAADFELCDASKSSIFNLQIQSIKPKSSLKKSAIEGQMSIFGLDDNISRERKK